MSHHSDDQTLLSVASDSFWEPGNYKRTTRRIDDGHRLCGELQVLVQERADIEKTYAKSLRGWAKKWNDFIEKGPEYGTMEAAWKGGMVEAERLSDLHLGVRDRLVNDVIVQIKNWQKDTYHKSMIQLKERKEMDEAFKKAQKPWAKLLQKVERTRLEYHTACKQERTAQNQERNASGDSSLSPDQVKKMADRVSKCREEVNKSRDKYQAALAEITAYNPRYMEDMTAVFEKCQQMEAQRLTFFKDVLFGFHKCLNISQEPSLPQIYEEFHHTINNADHQKDLKWWANNHGVNMAMAWPQFEVTFKEPPSESEPVYYMYVPEAASAAFGRVLASVSETVNAARAPAAAAWLRVSALLPLCCAERDKASRVAPSLSSGGYIYCNPLMEYTEEFREIAKGKSKESLPTAPITLLNQRPVSEDELPPLANNKSSNKSANHTETVTATHIGNNTANNTIDKKSISAPITVTIERLEIYACGPHIPSSRTPHIPPTGPIFKLALKPETIDSSTFTVADMSDWMTFENGTASAPKSNKSSPAKDSKEKQENPFEEEEWDEESATGLTDSGEPGLAVRALYDYTGAESDELSFRQGDLFEKLEDEDEQGWCKGRKDGRVGLYPANYVEPVGH